MSNVLGHALDSESGSVPQNQRCGKCKQQVDSEEFPPSRRGVDGAWCRPCQRAQRRGEPAPDVDHAPRSCDQCGKSYIPKQLKAAAAFCSKPCNEQHRKATGRAREQHLQRQYGISAQEYDRLLEEQGGGCAICGKGPEAQTRYRTYLHVDHCHATGKVRGLLCDEHNLLLGRWGDTTALLRRALEYLERAEQPR